jgi:hypothetical protein
LSSSVVTQRDGEFRSGPGPHLRNSITHSPFDASILCRVCPERIHISLSVISKIQLFYGCTDAFVVITSDASLLEILTFYPGDLTGREKMEGEAAQTRMLLRILAKQKEATSEERRNKTNKSEMLHQPHRFSLWLPYALLVETPTDQKRAITLVITHSKPSVLEDSS